MGTEKYASLFDQHGAEAGTVVDSRAARACS
jgi:hypothetical protein